MAKLEKVNNSIAPRPKNHIKSTAGLACSNRCLLAKVRQCPWLDRTDA